MPAYSVHAMGHDFTLIDALVGGFSAALLLGYLAQKLEKGVVDQFAEIGVILLMFGVGLHFHLKDLIAVQRHVALCDGRISLAPARRERERRCIRSELGS